MKKKTVRLWKWPEEEDGLCTGCCLLKNYKCSFPDAGHLCLQGIFKTERPEQEFVDVDINE